MRVKELCMGLKEISPQKASGGKDPYRMLNDIKLQDFPQRFSSMQSQSGQKRSRPHFRRQSANLSEQKALRTEENAREPAGFVKLTEQLDQEWEEQLQATAETLYELLLAQKNLIHCKTRLTQRRREIVQVFPARMFSRDALLGAGEISAILQQRFGYQHADRVAAILGGLRSNIEVIQLAVEAPFDEILHLKAVQVGPEKLELDPDTAQLFVSLLDCAHDARKLTLKLKSLYLDNISLIKELFEALQNRAQPKNMITCQDLQLFLQLRGFVTKQHEMMLLFKVINPNSMTQIVQKDFMSFFLT